MPVTPDQWPQREFRFRVDSAHHTIATINNQLRHTGRTTPTPAETHTLTTATTTLRKALRNLADTTATGPASQRSHGTVIPFPTRACARHRPIRRRRGSRRPSAPRTAAAPAARGTHELCERQIR